jgi:hypothetical protein
MNPDGQVYADFDGTAPEADKQRFLAEESLVFTVGQEAERIISQMRELERMLDSAKGG